MMPGWLSTLAMRAALLVGLAGCHRSPPHPAGPPPCTTDTWENYGESVTSDSCNGCHETVYADPTRVHLLAWSMADSVSHERMPPADGPSLTTAERERYVRWLKCGAPRQQLKPR